jgi:hypothetical protein
MALTIGTPTYFTLPQARGRKMGFTTVTFDSSYPTGGEAIVYTDIPGLASVLDGMWQIGSNLTTYQVFFDKTGATLVAWDENSEAPNTTNLASLTVTMAFIGT